MPDIYICCVCLRPCAEEQELSKHLKEMHDVILVNYNEGLYRFKIDSDKWIGIWGKN